uniref:Uncharacterized protein n=1 Tax=Arundo donax TaxID=35708 RepID=A0A0A9HIA5_ARUDO
MTNKGLKQVFGFRCCSYPLHWHFRFVCWEGWHPLHSNAFGKIYLCLNCQGLRTFYSSLRHASLVAMCFWTQHGLGYIYRQDIAVIDHCTTTKAHRAQAEVACLHLRSSNMANTRSCCSRLFPLAAFVCLLVVHPAAMVNGLRREELVLGPDTAPVPAVALTAGGSGGINAAGVDVTGKRFTAVTARSVGAVQMSKWRVWRGSDPIHNRS